MARQRLNKKLIVVLTLGGFAIIVAASALVLRQLQRGDPRQFQKLAEEHAAREEWQTAAAFYQKAWSRSRDPAYLISLGEVHLQAGDVALALRAWEEALVQNPKLLAAHQRKLELLLEVGELYPQLETWREVLKAANAWLEQGEEMDPAFLAKANQGRGLALVNLASQDPQNATDGLSALATARELAPENVQIALDLAVHSIRQGRSDEGERLLQDLMRAHTQAGPDAANVYVTYAKYLTNVERFEEAQRAFDRGIELSEGTDEPRYEAAVAYGNFLGQRWAAALARRESGESADVLFAQAVETLERCIAEFPLRFRAPSQLTRLNLAARRYDEAVAVCERRLAQGIARKGVAAAKDRRDSFQLMLLAAEACLLRGANFSAEDHLEERNAQLARAEEFLKRAEGEFPQHPRLMSLRGRLLLTRGQDRPALEELRHADDAYRSFDLVDWDNKLTLASLHLKLREPGAAKSVLTEALHRVPRSHAVPTYLAYAEALLGNNELGPELDQALAQVLLLDPENSRARRLQAAVLDRKGQPAQAGELMGESDGLRPLLTARQHVLDGHVDQAIAVLQEAIGRQPASPQLVSALVLELLGAGRVAEAQEIVDRSLSHDPDNLQLKRLALLTRTDLSPEERDSAVVDLIAEEPDAYRRAWDLIGFHWRRQDAAAVLAAVGEAEAHLDALDTPAARNATIAQRRALLELKMRLAAQLDNAEAMEAARQSARVHNVDGAGGHTLLGLYHLYRGELDQAVKAFRDALAEQPTSAATITRLAECLQRLGQFDDARVYYERALRINPNNGVAHKGLAALAKVEGDEEGYAEHLRSAASFLPGDPWVTAELLVEQERKDPVAAIKRRKALLETAPNDVANVARLAVLCEEAGDLTEADRFIERMIELAPGDREVVVAVARYYRRTQRPEKALERVKAFIGRQPSPAARADAQVLVAAHHLSLGDLDGAEQALLQAADIEATLEVCNSLGEFYLRSRRRADEALRWFDRAAELARQTESPKLAQLLSARIACLLSGETSDLEAVRGAVAELKERYPEEPKGWLWDSEVYAREGRIDRAIAALGDFLARRPGEPYALFQRAQYYRQQGQFNLAIQDLEAIKHDNKLALRLEPRFTLAAVYLELGRKEAYVRELEAAADDAPGSVRAVEELARAYLHLKRYDDADRLLTAEINRPGGAKSRWFAWRSRVSQALGQYDDALADLHRAAELEAHAPAAVTSVLEVYLAAGRPEEGIRFYEERAARQPTLSRPVSLYARLLAGAGHTERAVDEFRTAMTLACTESADAVRAVTADLRLAIEPEEALAHFTRSVPGGAASRANERILVRLYQLVGRMDEAHARLTGLIDSALDDRDRAALLVERGNLYQLSRKPLEARVAYEEALRYEPDNWIVLNNIAYLLTDDLGEHRLALPYAQKAASLSDGASTIDTLGWVYCGLGRYAEAIAELGRAVRLDPGMPLSYLHLGEAHRRNGGFAEARAALQRGRAVAQEANNADLLRMLDQSLERCDRLDPAP